MIINVHQNVQFGRRRRESVSECGGATRKSWFCLTWKPSSSSIMDAFPSRWGKPRNEYVDEHNTVPLHKSLPDGLTQAAYGPVTRTQWVVNFLYIADRSLSARLETLTILQTTTSYGHFCHCAQISRRHHDGCRHAWFIRIARSLPRHRTIISSRWLYRRRRLGRPFRLSIHSAYLGYSHVMHQRCCDVAAVNTNIQSIIS